MMTSQADIEVGNAFTRFMASGYGRFARLAFGVVLIAVGLLWVPLPAGFVVAGLGLVPTAAGALNLCPVAPLWGGHFSGARYCHSTRGARPQ